MHVRYYVQRYVPTTSHYASLFCCSTWNGWSLLEHASLFNILIMHNCIAIFTQYLKGKITIEWQQVLSVGVCHFHIKQNNNGCLGALNEK